MPKKPPILFPPPIALVFLEKNLAASECQTRLCLRDLLLGHRHEILGENGDVGQLSWFERPQKVLLKSGVGAVKRIGAQRFFPAQTLFREEGRAVLHFSGYGRIERRDRVDVLDRGLRSLAEDGPSVHDRPPNISSLLGPLLAEFFDNPWTVRGTVDSLHRRDDAETAEAGGVRRGEVLGMLHPPAQAFFLRLVREGLFIDV